MSKTEAWARHEVWGCEHSDPARHVPSERDHYFYGWEDAMKVIVKDLRSWVDDEHLAWLYDYHEKVDKKVLDEMRNHLKKCFNGLVDEILGSEK